MKKFIHIVCGVCLILLGLPGMAAADSKFAFQSSTSLSTWLWDTSKIVSDQESIIHNLVNNNVKVLLLQIDTTLEQKHYKEFISKATANGIRVHALDGAPGWVANNGTTLQQIFLKWLNNYQESASSNEKFSGIHLDVEPYEHEQYEDNTNEFLEEYQSMMMTFRNQADPLQLEFGIDIPFWFYGVQYNTKYGSGNMAEWLCKNVEFITIMAYRDAATGTNGIMGISAAEMKLFEKYKVKGTIAVETGRLAEEYQFVTFYEEDKAYMNQQLELVYQNYKDNPAFHGIAIHHYDSWMTMK
ncbi:amidase [Paenibacillus sp. LMG 31457]|uniref:Amidase n=2 Tax=Paenibacillus planticolens TaxID=2654976 RepID=A0ABX1ZUR2_9BACL|nr:amidase [Paenibacillus planticolens]